MHIFYFLHFREGILHDKDGGLVLTGTYVDDKLHGIAHIISGSVGSFLEVRLSFYNNIVISYYLLHSQIIVNHK